MRHRRALAMTAALPVVLGAALSAVTNIGTGLPLPGWTRSPALIGSLAGVILVSIVWLTIRQQRLVLSAGSPQPTVVARSRARRRFVGPIILLLVAIPASVIVSLIMLEPAQFSTITISHKTFVGLTSFLGLSTAAPEWLYAPAEWLAHRPSMASWLVALALFLWAGCRPPLDSQRGSQPSSWLVTAGWLSALAAVTCGAGRWLVAAYVGLMAALALLRSKSLPHSVRDSAENMLESLIVAIFLPLWMTLAVAASIVPRFTGQSKRPPPPKRRPYTQVANHQLLDLAYKRIGSMSARDEDR